MRELQDRAASEAGGLLRVLLLRFGEVPAYAVPRLLWIIPKKDGAHRNMWGEDGNGVRLIKLNEQ
jgi:hypothetical protein